MNIRVYVHMGVYAFLYAHTCITIRIYLYAHTRITIRIYLYAHTRIIIRTYAYFYAQFLVNVYLSGTVAGMVKSLKIFLEHSLETYCSSSKLCSHCQANIVG